MLAQTQECVRRHADAAVKRRIDRSIADRLNELDTEWKRAGHALLAARL